MKRINKISVMQRLSRSLRQEGKTIGFVPTMGYLHAGHLSLAAQAKKDCDSVVLSIYVNPLQFGPKEDYGKYPRNLRRDGALARKAGVDFLFLPSDREMYPAPYLTTVDVRALTETLCGAARPGHFRGVTTVVTKLFNIVGPHIAYFGQKDAQQAVVIKKMAADLNMPLKIKVMPIIREPDGLAMSSRNACLSARERGDAKVLYRSLCAARQLIAAGERRVPRIKENMRRMISSAPAAKIEYISVVDAVDLSQKQSIEGRVLITLAVYIGRTRLIDNMILNSKRQVQGLC